MRLYLFSPSQKWSYCGGATLIVADSLQEALSFGNAAKEWEIAETDKPKFVVTEDEGLGINYWVFRDVFELAIAENKGIIFTNANYA